MVSCTLIILIPLRQRELNVERNKFFSPFGILWCFIWCRRRSRGDTSKHILDATYCSMISLWSHPGEMSSLRMSYFKNLIMTVVLIVVKMKIISFIMNSEACHNFNSMYLGNKSINYKNKNISEYFSTYIKFMICYINKKHGFISFAFSIKYIVI